MDDEALLAAFLAGEIDNRGFAHADHVRVAFALLQRQAFPDAVATFCASLKALVARAGHPEAYHETITIAFLALIAERMAEGPGGYDAFAAANPDLFSKSVLERWYAPDRLASAQARRTFLLPDVSPARPC